MAGTVIGYDFHCGGCRYNLRGLTLEQVCPECGVAVIETVTELARCASSQPRGVAIGLDGQRFDQSLRLIAELFDVPADAVDFVYDAFVFARTARLSGDPRMSPDRVHVSARELCLAVRDFAVVHFGARRARRVLGERWRITRSEDIGRIVRALVKVGVVRPSPEENPFVVFDGLYTLDDLLPPA